MGILLFLNIVTVTYVQEADRFLHRATIPQCKGACITRNSPALNRRRWIRRSSSSGALLGPLHTTRDIQQCNSQRTDPSCHIQYYITEETTSRKLYVYMYKEPRFVVVTRSGSEMLVNNNNNYYYMHVIPPSSTTVTLTHHIATNNK
jgi:hypothetical protein